MVDLQQYMSGSIRNIMIPFEPEKTTYRVETRLLQGRERAPAGIELSGWTIFANKDTDATFAIDGGAAAKE